MRDVSKLVEEKKESPTYVSVKKITKRLPKRLWAFNRVNIRRQANHQQSMIGKSGTETRTVKTMSSPFRADKDILPNQTPSLKSDPHSRFNAPVKGFGDDK